MCKNEQNVLLNFDWQPVLSPEGDTVWIAVFEGCRALVWGRHWACGDPTKSGFAAYSQSTAESTPQAKRHARVAAAVATEAARHIESSQKDGS